MSARETLTRLEAALAPASSDASVGPVASADVPRASAAGSVARDAAVAVIFRIASDDSLELLMIERASYEGDPWSGHVAFPGGRREAHDPTLLDTALRETREEIGLDLARHGHVLGALERLNPVSPSLPPLSIAPFVVMLAPEHTVELTLSDEVAETFWVPLTVFQRTDASSDVEVVLSNGATRTVRAFVHGRYAIWGLTERIIRDLLSRIS